MKFSGHPCIFSRQGNQRTSKLILLRLPLDGRVNVSLLQLRPLALSLSKCTALGSITQFTKAFQIKSCYSEGTLEIGRDRETFVMDKEKEMPR